VDIPELLDDDGGVGKLAPGPVAAVRLLQPGRRAILGDAFRHGRGAGGRKGGRVRNVQRGRRQHRLRLHFFCGSIQDSRAKQFAEERGQIWRKRGCCSLQSAAGRERRVQTGRDCRGGSELVGI
jgi:hypothetical protein